METPDVQVGFGVVDGSHISRRVVRICLQKLTILRIIYIQGFSVPVAGGPFALDGGRASVERSHWITSALTGGHTSFTPKMGGLLGGRK